MIELFAANTPNGIKIPIALEELEAPYTLSIVDLANGEARSESYRAINPNGKIPALRHRATQLEEVVLFESGAILLYLADLHGRLIGSSASARASTLSWLFLQVSGLGPAMGAAAYYRRSQESGEYSRKRYANEARRLLELLNNRLKDAEWLNGEGYSVADIANFTWARNPAYAGVSTADLPHLLDWVKRIESRPATKRALAAFD